MDWQKKIADILSTQMTQEEVAKAISLKQGRVSRIASGHVKFVRWETGDAILRLHKRKKRKMPLDK